MKHNAIGIAVEGETTFTTKAESAMVLEAMRYGVRSIRGRKTVPSKRPVMNGQDDDFIDYSVGSRWSTID